MKNVGNRNILLTIFTPTYNRAYILSQLYNSLCRQTNSEFVWLVVDDGSTDDTEQLVEQWMQHRQICIRYIKQPNGGKHRAHNTAVEHCNTPWFVCVDSDDYMVDEAVDIILQRIARLEKRKCVEKYSAIVAPRKQKELKNERIFATSDEATLTEIYRNGFVGETTLVFRTEVLRNYPFPTFDGEKFVTEGVVYDEIDKRYTMALIPDMLVACEYREDGYSLNEKRLFLQNPKGWAYRFNQRTHLVRTWKERYVCCAKYVCFSMMAHQGWLRSANDKFCSLLAIPLAIYYKYTRYKK